MILAIMVIETCTAVDYSDGGIEMTIVMMVITAMITMIIMIVIMIINKLISL